MKYIDINEVNNLKEKYPYLFIPYIFKLQLSSSVDFNNTLNSLSIRHPKRDVLESFIKKNSISTSQLLDNFIIENPKITKAKSKTTKEDLSETHIISKKFYSENIAKIYIKQKKIKEAIKIYEKLISLNSKKKSYFAKKIENLKK